MRAETIASVTRLYPFLSGCGTLANHPAFNVLTGRKPCDTWARVRGGILSVDLSDYVGRSAYYVGDLDRKVSLIIDRFVERGDTVLDIGANIGLTALRLRDRVGQTGKVHAFEPNPTIAARFKRTLAANQYRNIFLHEVALGAEEGMLSLHVPEGNAGAASFLIDYGETVKVPVKRLDDMGFENVSFVKMDVEGFEDQVLRGFVATLEKSPPRAILFEQNTDAGQSIPILMRTGYRISGVARTLMRLKLVPVECWSPDYHDYLATR